MQVDALVIGAGPTGLMMAAELARHGLSCRIIDKSLIPSDKSKALAIQSRTLEILDQIGVIKKFLEEGLKVVAFSPSSKGKVITTISFKNLNTTYPFILSIEQSRTETLLTEHLATFKVQVERGKELIAFSQNENEVRAVVRNVQNGEEETITTSWMIGCDGAHSLVRKELSLEFEGEEFPKIFALADVEIDWKYPHTQGFALLDPEGPSVAIPLPDIRRYRLIYLSEKEPDLNEVTELVRKQWDPKAIVTHPRWMANFRINTRMVSKYRVDRVFVAGDAAHIHSPVGGQGMNTGLQDAYNLAWKLAFVHKQKAGRSLLDSYSQERHAVGKALLLGTKRATKLVTLQSPFFVALRNFFIRCVMSFPFLQRNLLRVVSQLAIKYPKSVWILKGGRVKHGIAPGMRAPNAEFTYEGKRTTLFDVWRGSTHFKLLIINGLPGTEEILPFAKRFAKKFSDPIEIYEITPSCDPGRDLRSRYGEGALYLIRPDGYIAFRGSLSDEGTIEAFCVDGLRLVRALD
jgi:2-polyprenyl-6-methoxyphenol hydroxylase-like FAD-dependent oxidoreductase